MPSNEADKTGSHIIPHFLMKRVDNADHVKGRDKELGFKITEDFVKPYFGRDVKTDKLEAVFGELSDEDIADSRSDIIADHIYCTACEKKFSDIESAYAQTLTVYDDKLYYSTKDPLMASLFWTSVIWRASAYGGLGFKLAPKEENCLRQILNKFLGVEHRDTKDQAFQSFTGDIRYALLRAPNYAERSATATLFHAYHRFPYCLLLGEYVLFYYMKAAHQNNVQQSFFGLEKRLRSCPVNSFESGEMIMPIPDEVMLSAWEEFVAFVNDIRVKSLFKKLDGLHVKLGGYGKHMHPIDKIEILNEIMDEGKNLGRTFTMEDIMQSTIKVLAKNHGIKEE